MKNMVDAIKPWAMGAMGISIALLLKVTAPDHEMSHVSDHTLLKAGMNIGNVASEEEAFNYDFQVKDLNGKQLNMRDLKGKVVFLNLWATWCGPCRTEMPSIQRLYNTVDQEKVVFVMLSLDQDNKRRRIASFIDKEAFTFPVYQPASPLPKLLRVNIIPTTFIVSPDGKVKHKQTGMANYDTDEMRALLNALAGV